MLTTTNISETPIPAAPPVPVIAGPAPFPPLFAPPPTVGVTVALAVAVPGTIAVEVLIAAEFVIELFPITVDTAVEVLLAYIGADVVVEEAIAGLAGSKLPQLSRNLSLFR